MKKVVLSLVFVAMVASFSGCGLITSSEEVFPKSKVAGPLNGDDEEDEKNKPGGQ
ncbi:MAG: hypothetical protein RIE86_09220 [Imperialibacter sp.]|uniref:hypothetical protein n=1 Tax=Imperialibacter sp. TaxID=2038411 RepID=UPI0032EB3551